MSFAATAPLCLGSGRPLQGDVDHAEFTQEKILYAWGSNNAGQCFSPNTPASSIVSVPTSHELPNEMSMRSFAAGWDQNLVVDGGGCLWGGGVKRTGQLCEKDDDYLPHVLARVDIPELEGVPFEAVQFGRTHVVAAIEGGHAVLSWGASNEFGQVGHGVPTSACVRPGVVRLSGVPVRQVACGEFHSLVLTVNGEVFAFGANKYGVLGRGTSSVQQQPHAEHVNSGHLRATPIRAVAAGPASSMALSVGGRVFSWGCNGQGRLGLGREYDQEDEVWAPLAVRGLPGTARAIASGGQHAGIILRKGRLFLGGDNRWGQLGQARSEFDWTSTFRELPFQNYTLRVRAVALGHSHTLILSYDGELYTCGRGDGGQLGHGIACGGGGPVVQDVPCKVVLEDPKAEQHAFPVVVCGIDACHSHNLVLASRMTDLCVQAKQMPRSLAADLSQTAGPASLSPLLHTIHEGSLSQGGVLGFETARPPSALSFGCTSRLNRSVRKVTVTVTPESGGSPMAAQVKVLLQRVVQPGVVASAGFEGLSVSCLDGLVQAFLDSGNPALEPPLSAEELRAAMCTALSTPSLLNASFCFPGLYKPRLDAGGLLRTFQKLENAEGFRLYSLEAQVIHSAFEGLEQWATDHQDGACLVHRDQLRGLPTMLMLPIFEDAQRPEAYSLMSRIMSVVAWMPPQGRRELQEIIIEDCSEELVLRHCLVKRVREHCDETLRRAHQAQRLSREIWEGLMLLQVLWGANEAVAERTQASLQVIPSAVRPESELGKTLQKTLSQLGDGTLSQTLQAGLMNRTASLGAVGLTSTGMGTGGALMGTGLGATGLGGTSASGIARASLLERLQEFSTPQARPRVPACEFHLQALAEELVPPELEFQLFVENATDGPISPGEIPDLHLIAAKTDDGFEYIMPSKMRSFMVNRNFVPVSYTRKVLQVENHHAQVCLQHEVARRIAADLEVLPGHEIQIDPALLFFILKVRREHLVEDTLNALQNASPEDLRRQLKVIFEGEQGVDEGGLAREFFRLLSAEIFSTECGLFDQTVAHSARVLWFDRNSKRDTSDYWLVGVVIGLAIYNSIPGLDIKFPAVVFKRIKDEPVVLEDLRQVHTDTHLSLESLLQWQPPDPSVSAAEASALFEQIFCLDFTVSYDGPGGDVCTQELCRGGAHRAVTLASREEFARLYCEWLLVTSVKSQFEPFCAGVQHVCDSLLFNALDSGELELIVCGEQDLDFSHLRRNAMFEGFEEGSPYLTSFWEVLVSFDAVQKKRFLSFVTGSDLAPVGGLQELALMLQRNGGEPTERLPTAHTCFNLLLLPEYASKEKLGRMLTTAMQNAEGFGLE